MNIKISRSNLRLEALKNKVEQYPYQKPARRLSESEFDTVVQFIEDNEDLGHLDFEYAVNRMFLDGEKPKNFAIIQELLVVCNTAVFGLTREEK